MIPMKLRIAITSMISILVAMGLGRFALTPQMPHMLAEGQVNLTQASLLAAANFLGYLVGAFEIIYAEHHHLILRLRGGLWGSVLILLISAFLPPNSEGIYINLILRFIAGIASAWALVLISSWLGQELSKEHALRTLAFAGVGIGIFLTGIIAMVLDSLHTNASLNWLVFGAVAFVLVLMTYGNLPRSFPQATAVKPFNLTHNEYRLTISYAFCGVGYVLPATFLSKLAVDQFSHLSLVADAFWPLFGLAVIMGMSLLAWQKEIESPCKLLAVVFIIQGLGILACTLVHGVLGLLLGAMLVGGSFMVILQLTMRLGAEMAPEHVRAITAILTTAFAIGQFIGPMLSALSTHLLSTMTPALLVAAAGSFLAAFLVIGITF